MEKIFSFSLLLLFAFNSDECNGHETIDLPVRQNKKLTDEFYIKAGKGFRNSATCSSMGGRCQDDTLECPGSYVNATCTGSNSKCCLNKIVPQYTKDCPELKILSRDTWGARRPRTVHIIKVPVTMFFIHHTAMGFCSDIKACVKNMHSIQDFHMDDRGWDDIAYSFLIGGDGHVYEGRGWIREGAHTLHYDTKSLAVSFIGNFMATLPTPTALSVAAKLLECGVRSGYLAPDYSLYGHRDVRPTDCPGDKLYNLIRGWKHYNTTTDADGKCIYGKNGLCLPDYLPCNGTYQTGLCSGYSERKCCVPKSYFRLP